VGVVVGIGYASDGTSMTMTMVASSEDLEDS
jgi:hypothetical protein